MPELFRSILGQVRPNTILDIAITSVLIYWLFSLIRGTRAVRLVIGVTVLLLVYGIAQALGLRLLSQILQTGAVVGLFALVVVFQPEIRREILKLHDPEKIVLIYDHFVPPPDRAAADAQVAGRAFAQRFSAQNKGIHPTMVHAGVYSAVLHYLKAVEALKSDADGKAIVAKMKEMPTDDPLFGKGTVRADGRKIHPMYLFEAKAPSESKGAWDLYKVLETIPAEQAFRPMSEGGCPMLADMTAK